MTIRKLFQAAKRAILKDYVVFSGSTLPAPHIRYCGREFKDNSHYLRSAETEAQRLVTVFGCKNNSRILDIGCGQGRLPIGILRVLGEMDYTGIDVDHRSVAWCKQHIQSKHPSFQFHHIDIANERYNEQGAQLTKEFKFDFPGKSFDIIYLFSVFSHMREQDMRIYLSDFSRILNDGGKVFFTSFIEENVPSVSVNPRGYVFKKFSGPLHVVRYEKNYIHSILNEIGFIVESFTHRTEVHGQSAIYLRKEVSV